MSAPLSAPTAARFEPLGRPVRWGILAAGHIAGVFTEDLHTLPDECQVVAVASRDQGRADEFARSHQIPQAYGSYEALAADPDVDVIYIATPHSHHRENAEMCLRAGKHVLIEKPMTTSAADTEAIQQVAAEMGRFCCEATWTRFNPLMRQAVELVRQGALGELRHISCWFAFAFDEPDEHRIFNPALAGGAVWDLGVYPASMLEMLAGRPDRVQATVTRGRTGVDTNAAATLIWEQGPIFGQMYVGLEATTASQLEVTGTVGRIQFDHFIRPTSMRLVTGDTTQELVTALPGHGYTFQAQEVHRCLQSGVGETPITSWQASLDVAWITDQWLAGQ